MSKGLVKMSLSPAYNLKLEDYSLDNILDLFGLTREITPVQLIRAKKKMLMVHPDKSRLPPEYFLFYQKAYGVVLEYYQNTQKTNQSVPHEDIPYEAPHEDEQIKQQIASQTKGFQNKFNQLFEKANEGSVERLDRHKSRTNWFSSTEEPKDLPKCKNVKDMNQSFDQIRKNTESQTMIIRQTEAAPLVNRTAGGSYYEDVEDEAETQYISSDAFSKLHYDDIRRVHKDQTIIPVGEEDYHRMKRPENMEQYKQVRGQPVAPLSEQESKSHLEQQETQQRTMWDQRWQKSRQKTEENEEKNKGLLAAFLRLR